MDDAYSTDSHLDEVAKLPGSDQALVGCVSSVADTELVLMANRMAWWPAEKMLLFADSHFGKAATFRKAGLPVPMGTTARMLQVLSDAVTSLRPNRLVILGDFIHSVTPAQVDYEGELLDWRLAHSSLPITLVLGNHDRHRQWLFRELQLDICPDEVCGPFYLCHDPFAQRSSGGDLFRLGGHLHPGIRLGIESRRIPCFWQGEKFLVFPAFGAFTGAADIGPGQRDVIFPISDGEIARVVANGLITPSHNQRSKAKR